MKLLIPLMLLAACAEAPIVQPIKTGHEGEQAPKLSLLLMDKRSFYSTADLPKGKTNVLFYFSPTCPHCRVQMRTIVSHMDELKDVQFTVLTSMNYKLTEKFYHRYKLNSFPNVIVGIDTGQIFQSYFRVKAVPFMAIYNEERTLRSAYIGSISYRQLNILAHPKFFAQ